MAVSESGAYAAETVITASAVVSHPEGVVLDGDGHPLLDGDGEPIYKEQQR